MSAEVWGVPPDDAYLAQVEALFGGADRDKPVELLRWQYQDGVAGPATTVALESAPGVFGAHYATVPRRLWLHGEVHRSAQSLDVMTSEAWRGRGLYLRLAPPVYERLAADGVEVVFGFPNDAAAPGFFGLLGWERLSAVPLLARPLPSGVLAGHLPTKRALGRGLVELAEVPEQVERLWSRVAPQLRVAVVRDHAFLRWRLDDRPGVDYVRIGAYERGRLVGFAAVGLAERRGTRVGQVLELLVDPSSETVGGRLLRGALRVAAAHGCVLALAWSSPGSPTYARFRQAGFVGLPRAVQPVDVHVGVRVLDRRRRDLLECLDPSAWYFSYLDSDTV